MRDLANAITRPLDFGRTVPFWSWLAPLAAAVALGLFHSRVLETPFAPGLAALLVPAVLVLANSTTSTGFPTYSEARLVLVGAASLILWLLFVFVQAVRHRDCVLPEGVAAVRAARADRLHDHAPARGPSCDLRLLPRHLLCAPKGGSRGKTCTNGHTGATRSVQED